ncbi:MAG TPA: DUF3667 domain-containing protein [Casimicrobiaceae bacterium]|nr:DUF3667 domain-containing protein [Casimicrobiaceae bacterium]
MSASVPPNAVVAPRDAPACRHCGHVNAAHDRYCGQCGQEIHPVAPRVPVAARDAHACRNCGHVNAAGNLYCGECGQETHIALPTARQFMREAAGRYVAVDGRLWRTLRPLMLKPGFLTKEYFAGRRRRYVRPGRLFLVTSIAAFAMIRFVADAPLNAVAHSQLVYQSDGDRVTATAVPHGGAVDKGAPRGAGAAPRSAAPPSAAPPSVVQPEGGNAPSGGNANPAHMDEAHVRFGPAGNVDLAVDENFNVRVARDPNGVLPQSMRDRIEDFNRLPRDLKLRQLVSNMFRYGPYAAIALLPAFALLLMLVYPLPSRRYPHRPRRFAGHLVFAAHNHAFLFVLTSLALLIPRNTIAGPLVLVAAPVYLLWSQRSVYGGGWLLTLARAFVLLVMYAVLFVIATLGVLIAAIVLQ